MGTGPLFPSSHRCYRVAVPTAPFLRTRFICHALDLPSPESDVIFARAWTDSRTVDPGDLFVAVKGDRFDGHDFIDQALSRGATGVLCRKDRVVTGDPRFLGVDDPLVAFRRLARAWRDLFDIPVIAVAGSVGKTTTKELLAAMLRGRWARVLSTEGSFNGFIGIPITLLRLRPGDEAAVIEIGIDAPGAMQSHLETVRPTAAVVTAVAHEHLETLRDLDTIAREESLPLLWTHARGGRVAVNAGDAHLAGVGLSGERAVYFGLERRPANLPAGAGWRGGRYEPVRRELILDGEKEPLALPLPGAHNAANALAAVVAAGLVGVTVGEMRRGLAGFTPPMGRSEISQTRGIHVLRDHYNASPASVRAGLLLLTELSKDARRWVCLGDMLELGPDELPLHAELAEPLIAAGPSRALLFGRRMAALARELQSRGWGDRVTHALEIGTLARELVRGVRPGDWVLVKGSRGMKMERLLEALEAGGKQ